MAESLNGARPKIGKSKKKRDRKKKFEENKNQRNYHYNQPEEAADWDHCPEEPNKVEMNQIRAPNMKTRENWVEGPEKPSKIEKNHIERPKMGARENWVEGPEKPSKIEKNHIERPKMGARENWVEGPEKPSKIDKNHIERPKMGARENWRDRREKPNKMEMNQMGSPNLGASTSGRGNWKEAARNRLTVALQEPFIVPMLDFKQAAVYESHSIQTLQQRVHSHPKAHFFCKACRYHCDNVIIVEKHIKEERHLKSLGMKDELAAIASLQPPTPSHVRCITDLLEMVIFQYGMSSDDVSMRHFIADELTTSFQTIEKECSVRLYGSSHSGFGFKESHVDLELMTPTPLHPPSKMRKILDHLHKQTGCYRQIVSDFTADIPVINFIHEKTGLKCTIGLANNHSYKIAELLRCYASIDDRVRKLGIAFRLWAKMCHIDNTELGMWPPHAFPIMLVYFLQQLPEPVLPVLHELADVDENERNPEIYLDPKFLPDKWQTKNQMSLGELWLELFRFYSLDFDFYKRVVNIEQHNSLMKKDISTHLPNGRIGILDPFHTKRPVTRSMTNQDCFEYCMRCFGNTYKYYRLMQMEVGPIFGRVFTITPETDPSFRRIIEDCDFQIREIITDHPYFEKHSNRMVHVEKLEAKLKVNLSACVVSNRVAEEMIKSFNEKFLFYKFHPALFIGSQTIPVICASCQKEGHTRSYCVDEGIAEYDAPKAQLDVPEKLHLDTFCNKIFESYMIHENEIKKRRKIVSSLRKVLKTMHPDVKMELFGSSCNGFGLCSSDIDICVTFTDDETGKDLNYTDLIHNFQQILKSCEDIKDLRPITSAKVPILKFFHIEERVDGDISFYNLLGLQNTKLLKTYSEIDPRVKPLGYMLKRFGKICDMCDASRGSLSSYAYIIMLIHYLQRCDPPVLPVLQELFETEEKPVKIIEEWDTYFYDDLVNLKNMWPELGENTLSTGELFVGLLHFYSCFDFTNYVVTIRQKRPLLKFDKMWNSKSMALEDPFNLSHNLGAGLSRKMFVYIINTFRKSYAHFTRKISQLVLETQYTEKYYFDPFNLKWGEPPTDRGCRNCFRIGHFSKECPEKKSSGRKTRK